MQTEQKKCPFCGKRFHFYYDQGYFMPSTGGWRFICTGCGIKSRAYKYRANMVKAANRRSK